MSVSELYPTVGSLQSKTLQVCGQPLLSEKYYSFYVADIPEGLPLKLVGDFIKNYLEEHMPVFFDQVHIQYLMVELPTSLNGAARLAKRRELKTPSIHCSMPKSTTCRGLP